MNKRVRISQQEMKSLPNQIGHGFYLLIYGIVKNWSFPFSSYLRFLVLRIFSRTIQSPVIGDGVTIWFPWRLKVGKRSSLTKGVIIDSTGGVTIGEGVRIAPYTCINTADHDFSQADVWIVDQGYVIAEVVIEDDVWIGSGVQINKGVRIGKGSVIGSGSVVTKDILPYSVAAGVPCKVIKQRIN